MSPSQATPDQDSPDGPVEEALDRDDVFHILQCRRRRLVLQYLNEYDGAEPASMSDIAEHIAAHENDTTVDALRSQERQRVYIALYQSHLPKMDDTGVIEYEQYRGHVKPTPVTEKFERYLFDEPSLLADPEAEEADGEDHPGEPESTDESTAERDDRSSEPGASSAWSRRYLYTTGGAVTALLGAFLGLLPVLWVATAVTGTFGLLGIGHAVEESGLFADRP